MFALIRFRPRPLCRMKLTSEGGFALLAIFSLRLFGIDGAHLLDHGLDFLPDFPWHFLLLFRCFDVSVEQQLAVFVMSRQALVRSGHDQISACFVALDHGLDRFIVVLYDHGRAFPHDYPCASELIQLLDEGSDAQVSIGDVAQRILYCLAGLFDAALDLKIEFFLVKASTRQVFLQLLELFPDAFTDVQIASSRLSSRRLPSKGLP